MKFETVTIKDIAKALGFSTSTVSRALRDSHEISEETKKVVLAYAEEVNYRPNPVAQSLKERRSKSIGVVVSEIANSFFSQVINGIESVAYEHGYHVIITQTNESHEREVKAMNYLASRSVDGILISLSSETENMEHLTKMHEMGMPFVFFDRVTDKINTFNITSDNYKGAYDATSHLIQSGFERIAFIGSAAHLSINRERLAGYEAALKEATIKLNPDYVRYCNHGGLIYQEVEEELNKLLKLKSKPDAVIACSDKITTNVFRYCKTNGIKIPNQLGLIGFSNLDLTEYLEPSLSIIRQQAFEMGENAAALMIHLLESKRPIYHFDARVLPPQLFIRDSSKKK
jgi:DNA-binding LacI/PurR family transcriptional regulator